MSFSVDNIGPPEGVLGILALLLRTVDLVSGSEGKREAAEVKKEL